MSGTRSPSKQPPAPSQREGAGLASGEQPRSASWVLTFPSVVVVPPSCLPDPLLCPHKRQLWLHCRRRTVTVAAAGGLLERNAASAGDRLRSIPDGGPLGPYRAPDSSSVTRGAGSENPCRVGGQAVADLAGRRLAAPDHTRRRTARSRTRRSRQGQGRCRSQVLGGALRRGPASPVKERQALLDGPGWRSPSRSPCRAACRAARRAAVAAGETGNNVVEPVRPTQSGTLERLAVDGWPS